MRRDGGKSGWVVGEYDGDKLGRSGESKRCKRIRRRQKTESFEKNKYSDCGKP